jgi:hypothetical protein
MRKPKIEVPNIFPDTLLFMLDDTGHEALAGNHTFYGLGGIALRASHNQAQLRPAWRNLRTLVHGDPEIPLHAFEFGQQARERPELYKPLGDFFREHRFVRLAVTATVKTSVPDHLVLMQPVILTLKKYLADIAALSDCGSVAVVFESSERANDALTEHFGNLEVERNGSNIPVEHCLMEKKYHEPALEVADFVANASGSMARWRSEGKQGYPKDFASIFHAVPAIYVRYMDISSVFGEEQNELMLSHELRPL